MLQEEGLPAVFARHQRLAEATRAAARAWGLEIVCRCPEEYSAVVTALMMPGGTSAVCGCRTACACAGNPDSVRRAANASALDWSWIERGGRIVHPKSRK
mgnify:CR=1 FL=1